MAPQLALLVGILALALGFLTGLHFGRGVSSAALRSSSQPLLDLAEERLRTAQVRANGELDQRRLQVEHLVAPLHDTLRRVEAQIADAERRRAETQAALVREMELVRVTSDQLRGQTSALATALRKPQARGRWGELQLQRVVEIAGMAEHVDFDTQVSVPTPTGLQRPDLVVRLAGRRCVVVDAKVSLAAFLEAVETDDERVRADRLVAHARQLRTHVESLAAKAYWSALPQCPEFVVLFVPGDAFLAPALEADPRLLDDALAQRVHLATPTTLLSLLRVAASGWQEAALRDNASEVLDVGRELHRRLSAYGAHVEKLGRALTSAVGHYNASVGSLERFVLPQARRLRDLKITQAEATAPPPIDDTPRAVTAAELLDPPDAGQVVPLPDVTSVIAAGNDSPAGPDPPVRRAAGGAPRR